MPLSGTCEMLYSHGHYSKAKPWARLQNSSYFCVFKYARAVKQKVCNEAENRERDWGETLRARKTLTPRFTDFFTDFEKKPTVLQSSPGQADLLSNALWEHSISQMPDK